MPDFQHFDQTSDSTLAKLIEVDSELTVQEADLLSQLESIQEKRRGLKTVISLFQKADIATATIEERSDEESSAESGSAVEPVNEDLIAPPLEASKATTAEFETEAAPESNSKGAKKTAIPARRNKNAKFMHPAKVAKRASEWQHYLREEFNNTSLAEAVSLVLQRQADKVFEIAGIVDAIFVDERPKEVGSKAHRQVSNILSEGARKNKWYRGQLGYYSMSKAATETNS